MQQPTTADDLERRLRAIEDRAAIEDLVARYLFAVDDRDMDVYGDCFTEDGGFSSTEGQLMSARGREAVVEDARKRLSIYGPTNHFAHQHVIELDPDDPDRATGRLALHAEVYRAGEVWISAVRYADEYRRCADGRWRFADRMLSVFYYLRPEEIPTRFGDLMRNMVHGEPTAAAVPEALETYREFYAGVTTEPAAG